MAKYKNPFTLVFGNLLSCFHYSAILFTLLSFSLPVHAAIEDIDSSSAFEGDMAAAVFDDCLAETEYCENDGDAETVDDCLAEAERCDENGQDFNSLFEDIEDYDFMYVDTSFAWDNKTINSGRFDYKTLDLGDTIRIPLVDSSQNKFYAHPFANYVTSRFGLRRNKWHYGIDVKLRTGDPVKCALDGIVRVIQFDRKGYGNVVVVRHHNGLETLYGHLSKVTVKANQPIMAGETVGLGGNTGRSTGSHLHFEIRYYGEAFNPEYIIDFDNYALKNDILVLKRDNFEYLTELRKTLYYTVRSGDNLSRIARRYGTTVNNLCRLNGITAQTKLSIGRKLVVRSGSEANRQAASSKPAQGSVNTRNTQNTQTPAVRAVTTVEPDVYYTVRNGDNLSRIAKRYGTTVSDLCRLNDITAKAVLSIGRKLVVKSVIGAK